MNVITIDKIQYKLPSHLKKMRGVLAGGIADSEDERSNYILSKPLIDKKIMY